MEAILALYGQAYDRLNPVICFDERPCFLIGDTVAPLPMSTGKSKRQNYAYEKLGSCAVLASIEPLTGAAPRPYTVKSPQDRVRSFYARPS